MLYKDHSNPTFYISCFSSIASRFYLSHLFHTFRFLCTLCTLYSVLQAGPSAFELAQTYGLPLRVLNALSKFPALPATPRLKRKHPA